PTPSGAGSLGTSAASARGPPVEVAITTSRATLDGAGERRGAGAGGWGAQGVGRAGATAPPTGAVPRGLRREAAACLTLVPRASMNESRLSLAVGLETRSKAPSARASTARAPWAAEKADTTTTGMLVSVRSRRILSTPSPSRPGMVRSSVIASGRSRSHRASASSPSRALPTTSSPALVSDRVTMLRIRALSSATTTRTGVVVDMVPVVLSVSLGGLRGESQFALGEDRGRLQQDDQPVADLGDRVDQRGVGARRLLHVLVLDGEHFLDAVDDHAGGLGAGLDDHDLGLLGQLGGDAEPGRQVVHGDDPAAEADHAADPVRARGDRAGLGVTDDLVHLLDAERVVLGAQGEDNKLAGVVCVRHGVFAPCSSDKPGEALPISGSVFRSSSHA